MEQQENNDKHKLLNINTTRQTYGKKNKQQTSNKLFICNSIRKKGNTTPNIQTSEHYEQLAVQIEDSNSNTERIMIRTTQLFAS